MNFETKFFSSLPIIKQDRNHIAASEPLFVGAFLDGSNIIFYSILPIYSPKWLNIEREDVMDRW